MPSMSLIEELQLLDQELKNKFSLSFLESLARETGRIQRARKCKAQDIVSLCVFLSKTVGTESLASLCTKLNETTDVSLSLEGLNQRFTSHTVQFFRQIFIGLFIKLFALEKNCKNESENVLDSFLFFLERAR